MTTNLRLPAVLRHKPTGRHYLARREGLLVRMEPYSLRLNRHRLNESAFTVSAVTPDYSRAADAPGWLPSVQTPRDKGGAPPGSMVIDARTQAPAIVRVNPNAPPRPAEVREVVAWLRKQGYRVRKARDLPAAPGSDTSAEAARSMLPHAGTLRRQVYDVIASEPGGLTCDEVEARMQGRHQTISARVNELRNRGLIVATDERRRTRSGRRATVWKARGVQA